MLVHDPHFLLALDQVLMEETFSIHVTLER